VKPQSELSRAPLAALALGVTLIVAGCGRTLVFAERDGVNFAIRADSAAKPPLEINFGLDRVVGTVVPPAGEQDGRPAGEAVNMFAGFQVQRYSDLSLEKPVGVDLEITTQFASGEAARNVAESPAVVAQIVKLTGVTIPRSVVFAKTLKDRQTLLAEVMGLKGNQWIVVAQEMAPRLSERPPEIQRALGVHLPRNGRFASAGAQAFLRQWAVMDPLELNSAFASEWSAAITRAAQ
jgi:hypothetical protein